MAYVVMLISLALAEDLNRHVPTSLAGTEISQAIETYGATLLPDATPDPDQVGMVYVSISVDADDDANSLATELTAIDGVETAFVKPAEALP